MRPHFRLPQIEEILMDSVKAQQIYEASKISMGVCGVMFDAFMLMFVQEWTSPTLISSTLSSSRSASLRWPRFPPFA